MAIVSGKFRGRNTYFGDSATRTRTVYLYPLARSAF